VQRTKTNKLKSSSLQVGLRCARQCALRGAAAVDSAAAMPKPARPKAGPTKRQHSSTTKELLLWGGASLRSPMRLTGCCCRATRTPDQQHSSTTKELLLWGGASLRSPMRLTGCCCGGFCCCYAKAGTAEGRAHKKTTQQHNKRAASLGWGFAALANAPYGVLLRWILLLLPGYPNSEPFAGLPEQRTFCRATRTANLLPGYSNSGPFAGLLEQRTFAGLPEQLPPLPSASPSHVRFRPLPSASPFRSCLS